MLMTNEHCKWGMHACLQLAGMYINWVLDAIITSYLDGYERNLLSNILYIAYVEIFCSYALFQTLY